MRITIDVEPIIITEKVFDIKLGWAVVYGDTSGIVALVHTKPQAIEIAEFLSGERPVSRPLYVKEVKEIGF